MHKNGVLADIICVEVLNLEIVNLNRSFKYFMLNLFNSDIFTITEYKYISCSEVNSTCPAILRNIERMSGCRDYFIGICKDMYKLFSFVFKGLYYFFVAAFTGFRIGSINMISGSDIFDRLLPVVSQNKRTLNEALRGKNIVLDIAVISVCFFFPKLLEIMKNNGVLR